MKRSPEEARTSAGPSGLLIVGGKHVRLAANRREQALQVCHTNPRGTPIPDRVATPFGFGSGSGSGYRGTVAPDPTVPLQLPTPIRACPGRSQ